MNESNKRMSPTVSKGKLNRISKGIDSRLRQSNRRRCAKCTDVGDEVREAISHQLHELLNSLWPAAARIELAISEETCPPNFRETLEQLGRCVEEAMTIASQVSVLVDSTIGDRKPA